MAWFSWGANSYGQLGQGHKDDQLSPDVVNSPECLTSPEYLGGGGGHSLVISEGAVYSCGSNNKGQLGVGDKEDRSLFQKISALSGVKIVKVCGGWDFSVALSDCGHVYRWGSNAFGQLGREDVIQCEKPEQIPLDGKRVVDIACGLRHSVFLTDSRHVLSCGAGRKGQLGVMFGNKPLPKTQHTLPVIFPGGCGRISHVVAGAYHSAAVTDSGHLFVWGDNKHGQCCTDPGTNNVLLTPRLVPRQLFDNKSISVVFSGWTHLLAKTADGSLYSWGRNDYGQLGRPSSNPGATCDYLPKPVPVEMTKHLACGSEHNMALLQGSGDVVSWGWNEHGMCGTGDEDNVYTPRTISSLTQHAVQLIGCGHGHSMVYASKSAKS